MKLFTWARENEASMPELRWMFAVPNFSGRLGNAPPAAAKKHGARLKAEGRKPGVLDVWWPLRRGEYVGLIIEMKYGRNQLSPEQRDWKAWLESQGWLVVVKYSAIEAQDVVLTYYRGQLG